MAKYRSVDSTVDGLVEISKALCDPHRVRALVALQDGELCVCRIVELLALAPSTVSKHMSILKQAGLVDSRKEGRWIYYRLPESVDLGPIGSAIGTLIATLGKDEVVLEDRARLNRILSEKPEDLCRKQRENNGAR